MNKQTNYLSLALVIATFFSSNLFSQQFYFSAEQPKNCGSTDGILTIVPMRGVPPFTYTWSTGSTELSLKNVPKGIYSATLTDATGATVEHTHFLNSEELDLELVHAYPTGGCNPNSGGLVVEPLSGAAPYSYTWSSGHNTAAALGIPAGNYLVTVQDANGCTAVGGFDVKTLPGLYYSQAVTTVTANPDCSNPNAGSIEANLYYSYYFPFTYAWSNGATGQILSNVSRGTYTVTVTDALGCSSSSSINVENDLPITGNVICSSGNTGTLSANLTNATAPVTYSWGNGQTGAQLSNLATGPYTLTATDALGCSAVNTGIVVSPSLYVYDASPNCFAGNQGQASVWVQNDNASAFLWDNGDTDSWATGLSSGLHTVTVSTNLGCNLVGVVQIKDPLAPPITISATATPADCANSMGGSISLTAQGGVGNLFYNISGPNGFVSSDPNGLQNVRGGIYSISVYTNSVWCNSYTSIQVPDVGGFEPELNVGKIDCANGYGDAEILGVTSPGVQYQWSNGANTSAVYNLTAGCYSATVSAGGDCQQFYEFCMEGQEDSLHMINCQALASGKLLNDLGVPGCTGTQGIPYQAIRTLPTGAINFTDSNGAFKVSLPNGIFELEPALYNPADIACPPTGRHTVNAQIGNLVQGLDFHYLNGNAIDHRVRQKSLRTAQPGYPFSLRLEVCNDGASSIPGTLDLRYGNLLGAVAGKFFPQHPGAFGLNSELSGSPDNNAQFNFAPIPSGGCELLQLDLDVSTSQTLNTSFITQANVSPASGDPTPSNNETHWYNTVVGSFDPNCVLAYPARNGNPRDGGEIIRFQDNTIAYQIFFQNTGNAAANQVVIRDPISDYLDLSTIRNIQSTHDMSISTDDNEKVLIFKFNNINLPDSTSDYAGSIGSIQYEIDLKPGIPLGAKVNKQAGIYFDFNAPVITNENILEQVLSSKVKQLVSDSSVKVFPNPALDYFGFYCIEPTDVSVFNSLGQKVFQQQFDSGLQRIDTAELPSGVYLLQLDSNGKIRNGKVVVSH